MAKIMLFGSASVFGIPSEIVGWLHEYTKQGHEFIVRDSKGADTAFHKALSSVGASKVTIYCMDTIKNNTYEFPVKMFNTEYLDETKQIKITSNDNMEPYIIDDVEKEMDVKHNRKWYEFIDRQMIKDCDMAISLWDGKSKGEFNTLQLLGIYDKPCYNFTISQ